MLPGGTRDVCMIHRSTCFLGWMCATYADPAQPLTTTGEERDDLDHDLSDLSDLRHDLSDLSDLPFRF